MVTLVNFPSANAFALMRAIPSGIATVPSAILPSNNIPFTLTKAFSTCLSASHAVPSNAPVPISITLSGILIFTSFSQFANAPSPIKVTVSGMVTLTRFSYDSNA